MEHKQVKPIKIEGVAFLARDMPTHALLSIIKIPQRVLNLQMLILKQKQRLKLQREISEKVSYSYLSYVHCTNTSGCTYLQSNMNITERDVELQRKMSKANNCKERQLRK